MGTTSIMYGHIGYAGPPLTLALELWSLDSCSATVSFSNTSFPLQLTISKFYFDGKLAPKASKGACELSASADGSFQWGLNKLCPQACLFFPDAVTYLEAIWFPLSQDTVSIPSLRQFSLDLRLFQFLFEVAVMGCILVFCGV